MVESFSRGSGKISWRSCRMEESGWGELLVIRAGCWARVVGSESGVSGGVAVRFRVGGADTGEGLGPHCCCWGGGGREGCHGYEAVRVAGPRLGLTPTPLPRLTEVGDQSGGQSGEPMFSMGCEIIN